MLYITVPNDSAHFRAGVNTIIVPRYLALESQLNGTLTSNPSGSELSGGEFYSTDDSQASSSGHIIAVIEKTMGNTEAENLLNRLTHDSTNAQIANAVQVSGEALYRLHLPADVQSRLPYNIQSTPLGDPYQFLTVGAVLEFVFDCLVAIGTALYNLAEMVYEAGVKFIADLTSAYVEAIRGAVDKIVDAFQAFVAWAVDFIETTLETALGSVLGSLGIGSSRACGVIPSLLATVTQSIQSGAMNENEGAATIGAPIIDMIDVLMIVATAVAAAVMILSIVLMPYSFLINEVVIPLVLTLMVSTILQTALGFDPMSLINGGDQLRNQMETIIGSELASQIEIVLGLSISIFNFLAEKILMLMSIDPLGVVSFVVATIGFALALWSLAIEDSLESLQLSCVGFALSILGFALYLVKPVKLPTVGKFLLGFAIFDVSVSTFSLYTAAERARNV